MTRVFPTIAGLLALCTAASAGGAGPVVPEVESAVPQAVPAPELAPIALLVDLSSGQALLDRDTDRRFVPASITKVMTLLVAFDMIDKGKLRPEQVFAVQDATYEEWHNKGSRMFLPRGGKVSVDDLLMGIAAVSANDGSIVLAESAAGSVEQWVKRMNRTARELGMKNSHFGTPNGWPDEGRTFTTARDLSKLARALITRHPRKYARYFGREGFAYNGYAQANHDPMIGVVKGADGIKTGYTNEAGYGFLGTAARDGRRLVMVVAATDSEAERARASRQLIEWGFAGFDSAPLFTPGQQVGFAQVQDGAQAHVPLLAPAAISAAIPKGKQPGMTLSIHYEGPLQAPVAAGERIAELEIAVEGQQPSRVPLITGAAVEKANLFQRFLNGLRGIVA